MFYLILEMAKNAFFSLLKYEKSVKSISPENFKSILETFADLGKRLADFGHIHAK